MQRKDRVNGVNASNLFLSLFISTVGLAYLVYGRKRQSFPFILAGLALMGFSYFLDSFLLSALIGFVLAVAPFFVR